MTIALGLLGAWNTVIRAKVMQKKEEGELLGIHVFSVRLEEFLQLLCKQQYPRGVLEAIYTALLKLYFIYLF